MVSSPVASPNPCQNILMQESTEQPKLSIDGPVCGCASQGFHIQDLADFKMWLHGMFEQHQCESDALARMQIAPLKDGIDRVVQILGEDKRNDHIKLDLSPVVLPTTSSEIERQDSRETERKVLSPVALQTTSLQTAHTERKDSRDAPLHVSPEPRDRAYTRLRDQSSFMSLVATTIDSEKAQISITELMAPWKKGRPIRRTRMDMLMACVLVFYCVAVFLEINFHGQKAAAALGLASVPITLPLAHAEFIFFVIDHAVNALFILEMSVHIYFERCSFFKDWMSAFDAALVAVTSVQMYVLDRLSTQTLSKIKLFRVFRLIRTVRVFRIIYLFKHFTELRVLTATFASSFRALLWSMAFLTVLIVIFALFMSFSLQGELLNETYDHELRMWMYEHYGNGQLALYTIIEATLSGCWPNYFRRLICEVSPLYAIPVLTYVSVVIFGVMRILSALFLKETMQSAATDVERTMAEMHQQKMKYVAKLKQVFEAVDVSRDGSLSYKEFRWMLQNEFVVMWLKILEIEVFDAENLFQLLDENNTGTIDYDEFLQGIMRLKGTARSLDVVRFGRGLEAISNSLANIEARICAAR